MAMSAEMVVRSSLETVRARMQALTGSAPQRSGDRSYRVEVTLRPEPIQVARAEQTLVRRGYLPSLAGAPGRVRLEAKAAGGCCTLRFESFMRIGAAMVELTDDQRATLETILHRLATAISTETKDMSRVSV